MGRRFYVYRQMAEVSMAKTKLKIYLSITSCSKEKVVSIAGYNSEELIASFYGKDSISSTKNRPLPSVQLYKPESQRANQFHGNSYQHISIFSPENITYWQNKYIFMTETARLTPVQMIQIRKDTDTPISNLKVIASNDSITYLYGVKTFLSEQPHLNTVTDLLFRFFNITINCVCCDSQGDFWIATNRGLRYNRHNNLLKNRDVSVQ